MNPCEPGLGEAEEVLRAIRSGEIDAFVLSGPDGKIAWSLPPVEFQRDGQVLEFDVQDF